MADLDDPARLAMLDVLLTDLEPDAELNEIVETARLEVDAPTAFLSLVGERVLLFREQVGLPDELDILRASPRSTSLCRYVVEDEVPLIVGNLAEHPRLTNRAATTLDVKAYLGVPVRCGDHIVGALCVTDSRTREYAPETVRRLEELAEQASSRLYELSNRPTILDANAAPQTNIALQLATLERELIELGPVVRLVEAQITGVLPRDAFERAGPTLAAATTSYANVVATVRRIRRALGTDGQRAKKVNADE